MDAEVFARAFQAAFEAMEQEAKEPLALLPGDDDLLTTEQTSTVLLQECGIGREHTLRQWRVENRGPRPTKIGGRVFYRRRDLRLWLAGRFAGSPVTPSTLVEDAARRALRDAMERRQGRKRGPKRKASTETGIAAARGA